MTRLALLTLLAALLTLLASPALAQPKPNQKPQIPQPRYELACRGPFSKTASHADLVKRYGAKNVTFEDVNRAEGEIVKATVLFSKDETRRLEIEWYDEEKRRPSVITVFGEKNRWIGPFGITNGMGIERIEQIAGAPFRINGFEFDVAGAIHAEGTRLEKLPGGCSFGGHFDIEGGLPAGEEYKRFVGEVEIPSDDALLRTLKPKLWIYTLSYPPE